MRRVPPAVRAAAVRLARAPPPGDVHRALGLRLGQLAGVLAAVGGPGRPGRAQEEAGRLQGARQGAAQAETGGPRRGGSCRRRGALGQVRQVRGAGRGGGAGRGALPEEGPAGRGGAAAARRDCGQRGHHLHPLRRPSILVLV